MRRLLALLCLLATCAAGPARAEPARIALVIGNGAYEDFRKLRNAPSDANLITEALRETGFRVTTVLDGSRRDMEDALDVFTQQLIDAGEDAVGLFFFAGHGVQSQGRNYLIGIDSRAATEQQIWRELAVGDITQRLEYAGNRVNFVVLDACRDNPLPSATRSVAGGLAPTKASRGMLIAYATAPGDTASDGGARSENSPYSASLAQALRAYGDVPAELMFKRVADAVDARHGQLPWYESGLTGADFCFGKCGAPTLARLPLPTPDPGLTGAWRGTYAYSDGRPGVPFDWVLTESDGTLSGISVEDNTFDARGGTQSAMLAGTRRGDAFRLTKTYDGRAGASHGVVYEGRIEGEVVRGTWHIASEPRVNGPFTLQPDRD